MQKKQQNRQLKQAIKAVKDYTKKITLRSCLKYHIKRIMVLLEINNGWVYVRWRLEAYTFQYSRMFDRITNVE